MQGNRKIINATPTEVDGIEFKSRLEASIYKTLLDRGLRPQYEPDTFTLCTGVKPIGFLVDGKPYTRKLTDITYKPDFKVSLPEHPDLTIYIEVKGFNNDVYPYKRKMFLSLLREMPGVYFFEVHTKKGLIACLEKLNQLYEQVSCNNN